MLKFNNKSKTRSFLRLLIKLSWITLCIIMICSIFVLLFGISNSNIPIVSNNEVSDENSDEEKSDEEKSDEETSDEETSDDDDASFLIRLNNGTQSPWRYSQLFNQINRDSNYIEMRWLYDEVASVLYTSNGGHCLVQPSLNVSDIAFLGNMLQIGNCTNIKLRKRSDSNKFIIHSGTMCIHDIDKTWRWSPCTLSAPQFDITYSSIKS
jgi:hypothetical protein